MSFRHRGRQAGRRPRWSLVRRRGVSVAIGRLAMLAPVAWMCPSLPAVAADPSPAEVFAKRIVPIFNSPEPSSCVQCHLAGVDLKDYILPDAERTFRSLRDQGLIDLDAPERSQIVRLIDRGSEGVGGPAAIHAETRQAERDAFVAWIRACAADPEMRSAPPLEETDRGSPSRPVEVIRHARIDRILESFEKNVWAWRFRCMNCHTEGTPQNDKHRAEHGDRVAWVKRDGAAATLHHLITSGLIDTANPAQSLLLRKPLGEQHAGGRKFVVGDDAYKGFRTWIEDVAAIRGDRYATAADLPPAETGPERFGTDLWLKLTDCPPAWGDTFLQARVFAWDESVNGWETTPIAVSDRLVFGKGKLWQHTLTLLAPKGSARAADWRAGRPALPRGRYVVKVFLDGGGRLADDWQALLGDDAFVGQAEFEAEWREGYNAMTVVNAADVRK